MSEKAENYRYWLKAALIAALPGPSDWIDSWRSGLEFAHDLWCALTITVFRLIVLATFPISVPLLALIARRYNLKAVERREKARAELLASLTSLAQKGTHG